MTDSRQAIAALGALAQETRLGIFRLLVQAGPEGLAAGAIADALDVPPSSLSFHLQQLVHAGLIVQRRASRMIIYTADFAAMNGLLQFLTESCCGGDAALCLPEGAGTATAAAASGSQRRRAKTA